MWWHVQRWSSLTLVWVALKKKVICTVIWCHISSLWPPLCMRYIYNQVGKVPPNEAAVVCTSAMTVWPLHVTPWDECSSSGDESNSSAVRHYTLFFFWGGVAWDSWLRWETVYQKATVMKAGPRPQTFWALRKRAIITEGHWNMEILK